MKCRSTTNQHRFNHASLEFREAFIVETAIPPRQNIRVIAPDKYEVYIDEEGNARANDGGIINVSKEDIEVIIEMVDSVGGLLISFTTV